MAIRKLAKKRAARKAAQTEEARLGQKWSLPGFSGDDPEVGVLLLDIVKDLERALAVSGTVTLALKEISADGTPDAAITLQRYCGDELCTQIQRLQAIVEHARFCGSQLVVPKEHAREVCP